MSTTVKETKYCIATNMAKSTNKDIANFRAALWRQAQKNTVGLTGAQVLQAMFDISEELNDAGVDQAWEEASIQDIAHNGDIFDFTWITALSARLGKLQRQLKNHAKVKGR